MQKHVSFSLDAVKLTPGINADALTIEESPRATRRVRLFRADRALNRLIGGSWIATTAHHQPAAGCAKITTTPSAV